MVYLDRKGQMIILMGVILVVSIITLAVISAHLANIRIVVPKQRESSILDDFRDLRETFGVSLNYNLVNLTVNESINASLKSLGWNLSAWYTKYIGSIENLQEAFNETLEEFFTSELRRGNFFDARLLEYYPADEYGTTYLVKVHLYLSDGRTTITENVTYAILCHSYLVYLSEYLE